MCSWRGSRGSTTAPPPEKLNGVELFVSRALLPEHDDEDDFYHADLIGLAARLADGTQIGVVAAVPNFGAGDLLEIRDPRSGDTYLYPFSKAVVPEIRIADGYLVIEPPIEAIPAKKNRIELSAHIITLFPDLFRAARCLGDRSRHGGQGCGRCRPRSCATSPPTGIAPSTTRPRAAAPAWC